MQQLFYAGLKLQLCFIFCSLFQVYSMSCCLVMDANVTCCLQMQIEIIVSKTELLVKIQILHSYVTLCYIQHYIIAVYFVHYIDKVVSCLRDSLKYSIISVFHYLEVSIVTMWSGTRSLPRALEVKWKYVSYVGAKIFTVCKQ